MVCYVMLCYVMLCYVMLCYVMLCYVMLCYVMLCYVMLCYVMLCYMLCHHHCHVLAIKMLEKWVWQYGRSKRVGVGLMPSLATVINEIINTYQYLKTLQI